MTSTPNDLWEFLMTFQPGERFPLVVVMIVFGTIALVLVVAIVAGTLRSMHRHRLDDALKRELVDRGMSAEEVEQIIRARTGAAVRRRIAAQGDHGFAGKQ